MFRASVTTSTIPPLALRNISSDHWKMFCSLLLTAIQRNVVYQLITGRIPNRRLLHYIMPYATDI
jgi:hypothetical protein